MKKIITIIYMFILLHSANCEEKPKIGLALAGGGALGFAHIGVLQVIDSLGIPIDYIAGTSMGGIVAGFYAAGYTSNEIENIALSVNWEDLFSDSPSHDVLPFMEKKHDGRYLIQLRLKGLTPTLPAGVISGQKISLLFSQLSYKVDEKKSFDNFKIPFRCIAVDLVSGKDVVISNGSLAKAMRSTMSIPSVFSPVRRDSLLLIDGGVLNNFPVDVVKKMGADFVIGLNLTFPPKKIEDYKDIFGILDRTTDIPRWASLKKNIDNSDLYIAQNVDGFSMTDFEPSKIKMLIERGKKAAYDNMDKLLSIKKKIEEYNAKQKEDISKKIKLIRIEGADIDSALFCRKIFKETDSIFTENNFMRIFNNPFFFGDYYISDYNFVANSFNIKLKKYTKIVNSIKVNDTKNLSTEFITKLIGFKNGDSLNIQKLEQNITELYSYGYFENISYEIHSLTKNTADIIVNISEKPLRKMFLGLKYDDYHKLVGLVGLSLSSTHLPGFIFESELQFAGLNKFYFNISYPIRAFSLSFYPYLELSTEDLATPVYDADGLKSAVFSVKSSEISLGFNLSASKYSTLQMSIANEYIGVEPIIGAFSFKDIKWDEKIAKATIKYNIDNLNDAVVPESGLKLDSKMEITSDNFYSKYSYVITDANALWYIPISLQHNIALNLRYFNLIEKGTTAPTYKYTSIGGPETFVGYEYYQVIGRKFNIARIDYRYKFKKDIFIKAIFNTLFNYEIVSQTGLVKSYDYTYGFGLGLELTSILGPVELMYAFGDKSSSNSGKLRGITYLKVGYNF